ncbi:hypothetical protein KAJ27_09875 [bacterium]|nr:hypothetical protein [bacterium]
MYQFTTPDSLNYDDRDELSHVWLFSLNKTLSPYLRLTLNSQIYYRHLMYLSRKRSSQNYVNRIYSLDFGQILTLNRNLKIRGQQRIFANYYIYDYESLFPINHSSMIFRGLKLHESIILRVHKQVYIKLMGELRLEEDGFMDWNQFIQEKTVDRNYVRASFFLLFQSNKWEIESGPYYHYRKDQRIINDKFETILDPERLGWNFFLKRNSAFSMRYSVEELRNKGEHDRWQQQGSMMINFTF